MPTRKEIQDYFIRVCRDAGFKMDPIDAAHFVARAMKISPLDVWIAFGTINDMGLVANGSHPASRR